MNAALSSSSTNVDATMRMAGVGADFRDNACRSATRSPCAKARSAPFAPPAADTRMSHAELAASSAMHPSRDRAWTCVSSDPTSVESSSLDQRRIPANVLEYRIDEYGPACPRIAGDVGVGCRLRVKSWRKMSMVE